LSLLSDITSTVGALNLNTDHFEVTLSGKNRSTGTESSPVTGLEWPRGLQEVKVPRFHDNGTGWW